MRLLVGSGSTAPQPIPVSNITLTGATSSSLTLSFTAPPSGSIVWNVRQHGASGWSEAFGTFGSSTLTITGPSLAASTAYDVQAVATNNGGSVAAELDSVSTLAVTTPPSTFSGIAPRFDAVAASPVVAPGSTVVFSLAPHAGNWPSSGSITASTGVSGDSITTATMAGGTGALSVTVTTSSAPGERVLTFTNTGGLRNPAPRRFNAFAASSGAAATLTAGSAPANVYDQGGFSLEKWVGSWGWTAQGGATFIGGAFAQIAINPGASVTALFGRIHDGWSSGATTTAGSGTQISNVVQISGPRASGAQTIYVHVPGCDTACYLDVSATSDMANAIRIPYRFLARDQWLDDSRSRECQTGGCYPYNGPPGSTAYCAYQAVTGAWVQNPGAYLIELESGGFGRHDGSNSWGQYGMPYGGVAGSETGRIFAVRKGLGLTMAGLQEAGGNIDDHWNSDGSPTSGTATAFAALSNPRYLHINCSDMTGTNTLSTQTTLLQNIVNWVHANWPSIAVIVLDAGVSGQFGGNGSSQGIRSGPGYTRVQKWITDHIETVDPTVISADMGYDWNEYYSNSGHGSYRTAIRYAQKNALCALMAESTIAGGFGFNQADRGATFPSTGTMAAGSGIIRITPTLPTGATSIKAQSYPNGSLNGSFAYSDATTDMAQLVTVYQGANKTAEQGTSDTAANYDASGAALVVVPVSSVTVDTNGDLLVHVPTSTVAPLTVQIAADFYRNSGGGQSVGTLFHDGRDLGLGIGRGPGARARLDVAVN